MRDLVGKWVQIYKEFPIINTIVAQVSKPNGLFFDFVGMFCRVCRQHRPPLKNGPKMRPFVEVGAVHYRKDYIERHINTEHHQHSIKCHKSFESGQF